MIVTLFTSIIAPDVAMTIFKLNIASKFRFLRNKTIPPIAFFQMGVNSFFSACISGNLVTNISNAENKKQIVFAMKNNNEKVGEDETKKATNVERHSSEINKGESISNTSNVITSNSTFNPPPIPVAANNTQQL